MYKTEKVREVILSGGKYSKFDISEVVGLPPENVRQILRDLRKPRFGSYAIHSARDNNGTCVYWFDPTTPVTVAKGAPGGKPIDAKPKAPAKKKPAKKRVQGDGTVDRIVNDIMVELFTRLAR